MADTQQYMRITLAGTDYLLAGGAGHHIESRDMLETNDDGSAICAWHTVSGRRAPAYALDADLTPAYRRDWQRAIFLDARPHPVGLVVDHLEMLGRGDVQVEPFTPLGRSTGPVGHLFHAAWVQAGVYPVLVIDTPALISYLQAIGGAHG
jgi:hypothetical protein